MLHTHYRSLRLGYPTDLKRNVIDTQGLAYSCISLTEQCLSQILIYNYHPAADLILRIIKEPALNKTHLTHFHIVWTGADKHIVFLVTHRFKYCIIEQVFKRHHKFNTVHGFFEQYAIIQRQFSLLPIVIDNRYQGKGIGPQPFDFLFDLLIQTLSHSNDNNDKHHADDHTQHSKGGTKFIDPYPFQGDRKHFSKLHLSPPFLPSIYLKTAVHREAYPHFRS